ncbi:MAG: redoxin domain-containing protein, partial [Planctomycetota bacterium]|nr:redoxin domain-containing protein [Planctomycetota bacterium]
MMALHEKYEALRDRFVVLAFHDATVKNFAELDEKLEPIRKKRWGGKALPFPILLDPTRATIKAFGISAYPTNMLIDPAGRVVKGNAEKNLEQKLEELAAAAAAKGDGQ